MNIKTNFNNKDDDIKYLLRPKSITPSLRYNKQRQNS